MGWVYVLINPSMPGIYKVGMTERSPEERAKELSSKTSVASPFIVVYKHQTFYPQELEYQVHKALEKNDSRINYNREFFEGDTSVAIRLIIRLANELKITSKPSKASSDKQEPWFHFEKEAFEYLNGTNNKLIDEVRAKDLFKKAEKLGSTKSAIELIKLKCSGWNLDNASIKKLNSIRDKCVSEASYLLFKHYRMEDIIPNCITLAKEILSNKNEFESTIIQHIAFDLGKIGVTYCNGYGFEVYEWTEEISPQESQSILETLKDFQDDIGNHHLEELRKLKGEWSYRYKNYVTHDLCVIATLGRIYENQRLMEFGCFLSQEQVEKIQEDEYCDEVDRVTKLLEEFNA